ncbi:U4/U6 small nuclear ribonucleoprotein Prp3-like [Pyrus ussuriensis x Pyrus communis]|uniref:U4/U6 small nuclear ribonucleoprotein Prp3-like n=1 Tax=Pyrus ussuriensis x Pyrus communis TaxID=2448454 RepID=A0A5N5F5C7_9ROSA|nr:U4/U6 small nuclear ribonucleoprotein Prp3-like [Pyrus ussuriensis x Pyrus communis]
MEKDKSSKRDRRDRDRDYDKHRSRDADEKRSSKDSDYHRHHHRSDRDSKREARDHKSRRERSREPSEDGRDVSRDHRERSYEPRAEREGSRERSRHREAKRERSEEREESKRKRKERERSEGRDGDGDGLEDKKRSRVSEGERRERKRFEEDGQEVNGGQRKSRRFDDRRVKAEEDGENCGAIERRTELNVNASEVNVKKEEVGDDQNGNFQNAAPAPNGSGWVGNGAALEPTTTSRTMPETSFAPNQPLPTKVSSIPTTNENKGVSITRSHEVHGNSSTDGTSSTAGKSANLSLGDVEKIKRTLQKQKELTEKLKKLNQLKKGGNASKDASHNLETKEALKPPSTTAGIRHAPAPSTAGGTAASVATFDSSALPISAAGIPNFEAVKRAQELAAQMGFHQDPEFSPLINVFPGQVATDVAAPQKPTKAPVLRLDALGREIDEHGNLVNVTKPNNLSTLKVNINKQKKEAFQILKPELDVDPEKNPHFDPDVGISKKFLRPKRMGFAFVEEGKWTKDAELIKLKSKFGEAQAKEQRAKQQQFAKAKAAPDINPNLIEVGERVITKEKPKDPIPEIEWWDVPLLHSGTYNEVIDGTVAEEKLKMEKITIYIEHPQPIEPPTEPAPPPPQPLKLTKKEQKKLRTQKRLAREKDRQEMIRQGLLEPPKPKVKMSNLMKVLGSEATQDPTRLEKEIRSAAAEREQAHADRNIARKLTPAERREKKERKLFDDPNNVETIVSVYRINELSHPKARFKIDVNARENRLTGSCVISDGINVVVVEGGSKSIKRYAKVMLRRINWAEAVKEEEEDDDVEDDKPPNKCVLVWQGSVARPSFNRFYVHECMTEAAARKIFADAGVAHYWDLAVNFQDDN